MPLTEPEFNQKVVEMMNQIIRDRGLRFDEVRMGTSLEMPGETTKFPDGVIWKNKRAKIASCLFEIKRPSWDPTNIGLIRSTAHKALELGTKYFATWNMRDFIIWNTLKEGVPLKDRAEKWYRNIIWVKDIKEVDRKENWEKTKEFLEEFLIALEQDIFERKKVFVGLPLDQFFISKLSAAVDINTPAFTYALKGKCFSDEKYYKKLRQWINAQGWHPDIRIKAENTDHSIYEKIGRIAAYILTNKILFYNIVRAHFPKKIKEIPIETISSPSKLRSVLQRYFKKIVKDVDYDTIYEIKIFDELKIDKNEVELITRFLDDFNKYDFTGINYEILGQVYEDLIPGEERHEMGQYFTPPSTVDLINTFCIQDKNDVVLDLGCGAGTFLVRAYARLKYLGKRKKHKQLLEQLWGTDIASFPAHLSTINLVLPDLREKENFPYIKALDAFSVIPNRTFFEVPKHSGMMYKFKHISGKDSVKVKIPDMDSVVGNPPYIRQEKIEDKDFIRNTIFKDWGKLKIGQQADIYVYFFIHGAKFLKDGGRLGFVTSNSWLDVRYGVGLQKFLLDNFKIIAVIESRVERSFSKADINTAITIVQRCSNKKERESNLVKFVSLKKNMEELIPQNSDDLRFAACDKLIRKIDRVKTLCEDKQMRVYPKSQRELYEEGLEDNIYVGSKWGGKYLRAPDIFFKILEKAKDLLVPLREAAEVKFGIKTGANEFFYLTDEEISAHKIEKEFLKPVLKSPRESESIIISRENLASKAVLVHKEEKELKGKYVLKYIKWGQEKGYDGRPTCSSRGRWYDLGKRARGKVLWPMIHSERHCVFYNTIAVVDHNLFELFPKSSIKNKEKLLCAMLNTTIYGLFKELYGRSTLGQGALKTEGIDIEQIPVVKFEFLNKKIIQRLIKAFKNVSSRPVLPIFKEVNQKDRQKLDNILFDILGLTKKQRKEVYEAVCELVGTRLEKAKTFGRNVKAKKDNFNSGTYAEHILSEVYTSREKKKFPNNFVDPSWDTKIIELPKIEDKSKLRIEEFFGKASLRIEGEAVDCGTTPKARFVEFAIQKGVKDKVEVPVDDGNAIKGVNDYLEYRQMMEAEINETIKMFNLNKRQAKAVLKELEDKF